MPTVVKVKELDGSNEKTWPDVHHPSHDLSLRLERIPNAQEFRRGGVFMAEILSGTDGDTELFTVTHAKVTTTEWAVDMRPYLTQKRVFQFSPDGGSSWATVHVKSFTPPDNNHGPYLRVEYTLEVIT